MAESFGARLRQQRERRAITLAAIAEQTKISLSFFEGLERDDVSRWPGGIFSRSYIRAYARSIGWEPDAVLAEFLEHYPDAVEDTAAIASARDASSPSRPPTRLSYLLGRAMAVVPRIPDGHGRHEPSHESAAHDAGAKTAAPAASDPGAKTISPRPTIAPVESAREQSRPEPDFSAAADLCSELARVASIGELASLLTRMTSVLDAIGLVVWVWDTHRSQLRPMLAHGYPADVTARLPGVTQDADNATAAAFRLAQLHVVAGSALEHGAIVAPLMTPAGCAGVLAVECRHGDEHRESTRALVTIFAALLATFVTPTDARHAASG